ncbi:Protoporphyrinogen oxidase [Thalassoglobus neptunius]|uniref:Coproporphyrinogen III oxidase n=1 Tax=Thalassoglobus neptunius TaxID=1938619 RepID=A0A5C5X8T8_9PLAN|nr:protoporphyrinogen oxidase [Thalassoglobus neptunius]TWT58781.1 Protoporphyrinogen oxidase [Thalassoglobus neptunius]
MNDSDFSSSPTFDPPAKEIAIVGAGISGLAAAYHLLELSQEHSQPVKLTIFDAAKRIGGAFGTEQIGDYRIERGADSFVTNKPWGVRLCERLGIQDQLISTNPEFRRALILHRGKPVETPAGFQLLGPTELWPMLKSPLLSLPGKLRVAQEMFVRRKASNEDESLASFVRRRFGQELLDNIVQPMVGGIYTSDPERLSLQATLPRFLELEARYGSVIRGLRKLKQGSSPASGARYGLFVTPAQGMQQLLNSLVEKIEESATIELKTKVQGIRPDADRIQIEFAEAPPRCFDGVVLALPAYLSASLLESANPDLSSSLSEIDYASSAIVVSGHQLDDIEHPLDAFGLVIPHRERRRILAVSFLSRKFPDRAPVGKVVLRTFVGGAMQPGEVEFSDDQIMDTVRIELRSVLGVQGTPDFMKIVRYDRAMPQYEVGHLQRVERIRSQMDDLQGVALAGNAFVGVGIPDCIRSGEEAAEKVWGDSFQPEQ